MNGSHRALSLWRQYAAVHFVLAAPLAAQVNSDLWGVNGELWDPVTGRLGNFTNAGYMSGDVAIPDWPVGVSVADYGAVPDDGVDDSQAFIDAIAACPDNHAVFVPNGRYTILQQIVPGRDHFVLRGEDMYGTVLHCPKYLNEIYVQEIGYENPAYDDGANGARYTGIPKGFFRVSGGTERSIENLSFEFREQRKMGHWEHKGADAIYYGGDVTDSWVRNIYIKNSDHSVMMGRSYRISFLNIILDHYIGRPDIVGSGGTRGWVGHIGMSMSNAQYCLFHNIDIRGNYFHEFDNVNVPKNCVVSNVTGTDVSLHHHGQGASFNLYTNAAVGTGPGISSLGTTQNSETHWRIFGDAVLEAPTDPANLANGHVFVGYDSTQTEIVDASNWYEVIDPGLLEPQNIYLAQLAHPSIGKPLPAGPPPAPPSPFAGEVIRINPVEDSFTDESDPGTVQNPSASAFSVGDNMYFKFDLNDVSLSSIAKVRLRVASTKFVNTPVELAVSSIVDDSWSDDTLTFTGRPPSVAQLDTVDVTENSFAEVLEFDVTPFVQAEWAGDKVVSLVIERISGNGFLSGIRSSEAGLAPELVIEQLASSVPGAPSAPAGVKSFSLIGNVQLDWADNPESDVASYNVYRSSAPGDFSQYEEPIATGLVTSDFVDIQSQHDSGWDVGMLRDDVAYYYRVTAVDDHGYESESSLEIVGTAKGYADANLPPAFDAGPLVLPDATQYSSYSGSLSAWATDPEGDPVYFSKVDGPEWLSIGHDGTLSGTPRLGDTGTFQFTVQINSLGSGRDEALIELTVDPGEPDAPLGLGIVPGDGSVQLDWSHSSEGSADFTFKVYRSETAGGPYTEIASGLTASDYTDSGLSNGTTFHYVVTALNASGESPQTGEVSATPLAGLAIVTNFVSGVLSDAPNWDAGLPVGKWGRVDVDATANTSVVLDGWSVLHTGGSLIQSGLNPLRLDNGTTWVMEGAGATTSSGFRGFAVAGGSSLTVRQGIINTSNGRDWSIRDPGSVITVHGGTVNLGRHLLLSSSGTLVVNGGTIHGNPSTGDMGVRAISSGGTLRFNGGTTTVPRIELSGSGSTLNLGGTSPGSLTAASFVGPFGSGSTINYMPGSMMSLTVSGEDEWASAKWADGDLTYNGQGVAELGAWAVVTAPDGLGPGVSFDYDSTTETLVLSDPDSDGDGLADAWEVLNFGSKEAIDGSLDSDGDGVLDFFEYLFGSDPNDPTSGGFGLRIVPASGGSGYVFQWETLEGFELGSDYGIEVSTNLSVWDPLPEANYSLQTTTAGGMTEFEMTLTFDYGSEVFLRLAAP
ncbi:fibronectin type III domain-containing protein [Haloferula helveola]|uniref:Probable pectate lyase C n=1 Tax=Haloferula helveola TaxID=490095 RepID=A0ABM7RMJ8_9BACT|nr:fibronectin type III domain-containing protein [Haloferula helveola]